LVTSKKEGMEPNRERKNPQPHFVRKGRERKKEKEPVTLDPTREKEGLKTQRKKKRR